MNSLKILLPALLILTQACGSGRDTDNDDDAGGPERRGTTVETIDIKYFDSEPSVSDDGSLVAFISGRSEKRLAYQTTVSADGEPERIFSEDLGEEISVSLAPNGTFATAITFKDGNYSIYFKALNTEDAEFSILEGTNRITHLSTSPDSQYILFEQISSGASSIQVGRVSADLSGVTITQLGPDDAAVFQPVWPSSTTNQTVIALKDGADLGQSTILKFDFSTDADTTAVSATEVGSVVLSKNSQIEASQNTVFFTKDSFGSSDIKTVNTLGNTEEPKSVNLINEVEKLDLSSPAQSSLDSIGFVVRGLAANNSGNVLFRLSGARIECSKPDSEDIDIRYAFLVHKTDLGDESSELLLPTTDENANEWSLDTSNVCVRIDNSGEPAEGEEKNEILTDDRISAIKVNGNASMTDYTLVYTTQFSKNLGEFGDREIRALKVTAGEPEFIEISKNAKPSE